MGINPINSINYDPCEARMVDTVDRDESRWILEIYNLTHLNGQTRTAPNYGASHSPTQSFLKL